MKNKLLFTALLLALPAALVAAEPAPVGKPTVSVAAVREFHQ